MCCTFDYVLAYAHEAVNEDQDRTPQVGIDCNPKAKTKISKMNVNICRKIVYWNVLGYLFK